MSAAPRHQPEDRGRSISLPLDGSLGLEAMDRAIITAMLDLHHHNVAATARADTTRDTLRYRIRKYGIDTALD